jgi:hypothetical protein
MSDITTLDLLKEIKEANTFEHIDIKEKISDMNNTLISHNGRLRKTEEWKNRIIGGLAIISIVFLPIGIYTANQLISQESKSDKEIKGIVEDVLSNYNLEEAVIQ